MHVVSHPEADQELEAAALWYEERQPKLGNDFLDGFKLSSHEWLLGLRLLAPMMQQRVHVGHTAHLQSLGDSIPPSESSPASTAPPTPV